MKYNSNTKYDYLPKSGGDMYDFKEYTLTVHIFESLYLSDSTPEIQIKSLITDIISFNEKSDISVDLSINDSIQLDDETSISVFIEVLESIDIIDEFIYINLVATLNEDLNLMEEINVFVKTMVEDSFSLEYISDIHAFISVVDSLGLSEFSEILINTLVTDKFNLIDSDVKTSETDFYIGTADGYDERYPRWLIPFGILLSQDESSIPIMPPTESTNIDIPSVDGSIVQETVYKNRFFNLVGYTLGELSPTQRDELKVKITDLLHETKKESKSLTFEKNDMTFDVKYSGEGDIVTETNGYLRFELPFDVSPFGRKQYAEEIFGDGVIMNDGKTDLGVEVKIKGGCINPNFVIDDTTFLWEGTVPENKTLIINNANKTCYLFNEDGTHEQAMKQLVQGNRFKIVENGDSAIVRCLNDSTLSNLSIVYSSLHLWLSTNGG